MDTAAAAPPSSEVQGQLTDAELAVAVRQAHDELRMTALDKVEIIRSQIRRYESCLKRATDAGLDITYGPKGDYGTGNGGLAGVLREHLRPFQDPDAPLPDTSALVIRRIIIAEF